MKNWPTPVSKDGLTKIVKTYVDDVTIKLKNGSRAHPVDFAEKLAEKIVTDIRLHILGDRAANQRHWVNVIRHSHDGKSLDEITKLMIAEADRYEKMIESERNDRQNHQKGTETI